jgi:hypothetical protein
MKGNNNKNMIDYNNKNLRPKTFFAKIERDRNGEFTVKRVNVLERTNQYAKDIRRVDARDFTRAIRKNGLQVA